ncbi:acetyltransferase MshD [Ilumatobacter coccineus YM16-304]|uniref:Mycothiol acetyltransferase n=2 Tax=Ilumatobacter coccineus TaxID=467094 RepID=A0A6C7E884_ILUCY|nr:acetyltransferase MshD [Ilumatobacter coccineus YM16-304]
MSAVDSDRYRGVMRCLEIKREMADDDIALVTELLDAAARADGRRPLSDHLYLDLVGGGQDGFTGLVAWEPGHEHPVAYAQISSGNDSLAFELVVHPHHRYDMRTIGPELMDAALDVVRREGGGEVNWWVYEPTATHRALAAEAGMVQGRTLYQMRRSLPTERHATIDTRSFVPGADDEAWLSVNNRAFADHSEQGGWTIDTLRLRQQEAWFDPDGFRMHERDGRLAGFCWTKVHQPDPATSTSDAGDGRLGEIYVIAVDPDFHGLGLGSEMTLAGLDHLADVGIGTALLYVDADNAGAVAMYEKLGFTVHSTNAAFSTTVDAGTGDAPDRVGNC